MRAWEKSVQELASHAVVIRGVGNTTPLKTTAWEAIQEQEVIVVVVRKLRWGISSGEGLTFRTRVDPLPTPPSPQNDRRLSTRQGSTIAPAVT